MAERVPFEGELTAPIVLIGEAPGHWEHVYGRPFVGPSYTDKLKPWWAAAGLERGMFRILNVLDYQPHAIDRVGEAEIRAGYARIHAEIASMPGPDGNGPMLIVPTGNYALYGLTGKGRVSFHMRDGRWERPGIQAWRGSILAYEDTRGRTIKVIPTVHPAAVFRQPGLEWVCQKDWQRIAADAKFRELRLPQRTHQIMPSASEAIEWLRWTRSEAAKRARLPRFEGRLACSLDVETPKKEEHEWRQKVSTAATAKCTGCGHTKKWHADFSDSVMWIGAPHCTKKGLKRDGALPCSCGGYTAPMGKPRRVLISSEPYLDCIGYAWDPALSLTIPTAPWMWEPRDWQRVREAIVAFHADPNIDFGGQNFTFDAWWCHAERMPVVNFAWDLRKMHELERPWSEWNDLAFQASLDTREPYWKDEAKDPDSVQRYAANREAFYTYNGKDNTGQRELLDRRLEGLRAAGRLEYYLEREAPIDPALVELSFVGFRTDEMGRAAEHDRTVAEAGDVAKQVNEAAGRKLVAKKAVSNKAMTAYLYGSGEGELRLPVQYKKALDKETRSKVKKPSVDVVAIKKLMERFPTIAVLQTVGKLVLRHRRLMKVAASLSESKVSPDGRVYGFFKQDTGLGRLSCGKPLKGTGDNLQNQDRKLRKFYLADEGDAA